MNEKLMNCFKNPIQSKILLSFRKDEHRTAKQLAEQNESIPQATLYRHLRKMLNDGVLKIVQENKIRGVIEQVYALAVEISVDKTDFNSNLSSEAYMNLFTEYSMGLMRDFKDYTSKENIDIVNDGSGFSIIPIYATKDELLEISNRILELLTPFMQNQSTSQRKHHSIGLIVTPPKNLV